uniref:Ribonuclease H protein At1g65750 family n=1 Tax=Cajanus cajan TaxID=3821 RepID=A0A151SFJ1_CAJCA|nr:Putative ribonuclease H protein At1g65750 family [Cajanus cajan]
MAREAEKKNIFKPMVVGNNKVNIIIVQYVDDTMIFEEGSIQNVVVIKAIMRCFELISGLKVNFIKSKFGAIGLQVQVMERYAQLLNCKLLKLPSIYLGLPIGANPRRKEIWNPVLEKIKRRLSNWKGKVLSMAGRVQLINLVLTSLPLYYLSFYKIPKGVSSKISRLQRQFLWGSNQGTKKMAWIKWEKVTDSKEKGGLGIKEINLFNKALLAKWRWCLFHNPESLWVKFICSKYGGFQNLCAQNALQNDSVWWKDLIKACGGLESEGWFDSQLEWKVNRGSAIRFWLDNWVDQVTLAVKFPSLFESSKQKHHLISEMGGWVEGEWNWRFKWSDQTDVSHIELEQELDWWFWRSKVDGEFSVKEAYKVIESESRLGEEGVLFKQIWSIKAPPKALIFLWRLVNRGIPSVDILKRRNLILDEKQSICVLYNKVEEIVSHLFCTCQQVDNIWKGLLNWINFPSPLPQEVAHHFNFIPGPLSSKLQIQAWRTLWLATTRTLWMNRNKGRFEGEIFNSENTIREITCTSW